MGELARPELPEKKLRALVTEMADLERLYADDREALDAHMLRTLPFRQRLRYRGYMKLRHKDIVG